MLARIERLEKQQKADAATWKRLNSDQQEVERKVDKVQDGMDSLADSCNRVDRPNNTECVNSLNELTARIDSLSSSFEEFRLRSGGASSSQCHGCAPSAPKQTTAAPAVDNHQPSSSQMAPGAAPASGPHTQAPPMSEAAGMPYPSQPQHGMHQPGSFLQPGTGQPGQPVSASQAQPRTYWEGRASQHPLLHTPYAASRPQYLPAVPNAPGALPTVSQHPVPSQPLLITDNQPSEEGNHCPGIIEPHRVGNSLFRSACDYRTYRLVDTRAELTLYEAENLSRLKRAFDHAYHVPSFSGEPPIALLSFLTTFKKGMENQGMSEALAARMLPNYLTDTARATTDRCERGFDPVTNPYARTYPHLVHALIERMITDEVIDEAVRSVTDIKQTPDETEDQFINRLLDGVEKCGNVFSDARVVQEILNGLQDSVAQVVKGQLNQRPIRDGENIHLVRKLATQEGKAHRARMAEIKAATTPKPTRSKALLVNDKPTPVLSVSAYNTPAPQPRWDERAFSPWPEESPLVPPANMVTMSVDPNTPMRAVDANAPVEGDSFGLSYTVGDAMHVIDSLEPVLVVGVPGGAASIGSSTEAEDGNPANPLNWDTIPAPMISADQARLAMQVVPEDFWSLSCWACRDDGHGMYRCPYLSPAQRLYFAYRYYLYQVQKQPHMRQFLHDRAVARQQGQQQGPSGQGQQPGAGYSAGQSGGRGYAGQPMGRGYSGQPGGRGYGPPMRGRGYGSGQGRGVGDYKQWVRPNSPRQNRPPMGGPPMHGQPHVGSGQPAPQRNERHVRIAEPVMPVTVLQKDSLPARMEAQGHAQPAADSDSSEN